jgi:hypothetical protein
MRSIFISLILAISGPAGAQPQGVGITGDDLFQGCQALLNEARTTARDTVTLPPDGAPCYHYFQAIQNLSMIWDPSPPRPYLGACIPAGVSVLQQVRIFMNYVQRKPAYLHYNAAFLAVMALREAYPCTGASPAPAN